MPKDLEPGEYDQGFKKLGSRCFLRYSDRPCTLRCCAQSTAQADEALRSKRHITVEDLQDPAHIGGSAKSEVAVQVCH